MNEYDINDIRTIKQFSKETFSKYKKSEVKKAFLNDLLNPGLFKNVSAKDALFSELILSQMIDCSFLDNTGKPPIP